MSIVSTTDEGWIISHNLFINKVYNCQEKVSSKVNRLCDVLFKIVTPFVKNEECQKLLINRQLSDNLSDINSVSQRKNRKRKKCLSTTCTQINEVQQVHKALEQIIKHGKSSEYFHDNYTDKEFLTNNSEARNKAEYFYLESSKYSTGKCHGANQTDLPFISQVGNESYIFPPNCDFFCYDVRDIEQNLHLLNTPFDLILLDPPWWNKYIRRKKSKFAESGYEMMYNEELIKLPIPALIAPGSLVAVWCTNCKNHLDSLQNVIFPAWELEYVGKWFWAKVTVNGEPVCPFSDPPGKQPFEQLLFGYKIGVERKYPLPENYKVVTSVPSAIHSHKPPLSELLSRYLPPNPRCLELFARYLLPGWASWGFEALKLQHLSLYQ